MHAWPCFSLPFSFFISSSLLNYSSPPLYFYICLFLFLLVGIGRWMRFSGMGGVIPLGNERGSQYSGYRPIFQCIGMEKICRSCRIERLKDSGWTRRLHITYHTRFVWWKSFLFLLCPGVEGGGLCIDSWERDFG